MSVEIYGTESQTAVLSMRYEQAIWIRTSHSMRPEFLDIREQEKILREIELGKNTAGILETDDLQDILEDDDMIVFE